MGRGPATWRASSPDGQTPRGDSSRGLLLACLPPRPSPPHDSRRAGETDPAADTHLAASDFAAAEALLRQLQPRIDADERYAFDAIYVLVGRRRFSEARDQWNRLAPRLQKSLQESLRGPSGVASPAADQEVQRRAAEALFVQGLLTARTGPKDEALRLLRQADGRIPAADSPP
jgi:hypothetical protein